MHLIENKIEKTEKSCEEILEKAMEGRRISEKEALELFYSNDIFSTGKTADKLRKEKCGDVVTYVVNRNINFTNICRNACKFCAFRAEERSKGYSLTIEQVLKKAEEAYFSGATELCIQGAINPGIDHEFYFKVLREIKRKFQSLHLHAYSPMEIHYIAEKSGYGIEETLKILKESGLDSIPGTAAEILNDEVRKEICPEKIKTEEWVKIIKTAHRLGIPTTATMLYGHVESYEHIVEHLSILRKIQSETHGFTEFVPLSFIHYKTKLARENKKARGASGILDLKVYAISRIFLNNFRNIQSSWVKLGKKLAQVALYFGANDFGGTLIEESISSSAGQRVDIMDKEEIRQAILKAGRIPKQRTTVYEIIE